MSAQPVKLLLPFAAPAPERRRKATRNITLAAVFAIAEAERSKSGGIFLKRRPEEILFISEVCYPLWIFPWKNRILIFDGFGVRKHRIVYDIFPDTRVFLKEMELSSNRLDSFIDFLYRNVNFFSSFSGTGEKVIEGLITDPNFTEDFISYLKSAERIRAPVGDRLILAPRLDQQKIVEKVSEITDFMKMLEDEAKKMRDIMKLLTSKTEKYITSLVSESKRIRLSAEKEISKAKSKFERRIDVLKRKYDKIMSKISEETDLQVNKLEDERAELKSRREKVMSFIAECDEEIQHYKRLKDEEKIEYWKVERKKARSEVSELERRIREISSKIRDIKTARNIRLNKIKNEYRSKLREIDVVIKRIEDERDEKLRANEEKIRRLRELTSRVVSQINDLIEARLPRTKDILKLGLPMIRRKVTLAYIPFFLTCYRRNSKRRYMVLTPSLMCSYGAAVRIRSAFGARKVRLIFRERSRAISLLVNQFIDIVEAEPMLDSMIREAGVKTNILASRRSRKAIAEGLSELYGEGWISDQELSDLENKLSEFTS